MERRSTNGHTSATADGWVESGVECFPFAHTGLADQDSAPQTTFVETPLAIVDGAEAVVYVLGAVSLLVLAAMIWTHYAGEGK